MKETWAEVVKSLTAGKPAHDCDEDEEKALAVGGGHPVVPESLDRKQKNTAMGKSLELEEVVDIVKSEYPGIDNEGARDVAKVIFDTLSH